MFVHHSEQGRQFAKAGPAQKQLLLTVETFVKANLTCLGLHFKYQLESTGNAAHEHRSLVGL